MKIYSCIKCTKGFSLVESLIVMAIIAIMSTVAISVWGRPYIQNTNLSNAANALVGDIYSLKQQALQNRMQRITINVGGNTYKLESCVDQTSTCIGGFVNVGSPKSFSDFGSGSRLVNSTYVGSIVLFQTRGTTDAGNVTLTNDRGSQIQVSTSISGRVSVDWIVKK